MKITTLVCSLCLATIYAAPQDLVQREEENKLEELLRLYDIDVETDQGKVQGIRLRRSGDAALYDPIPELDIKKINDQTYQVNGIRVKRDDLSDISDVDLEKEVEKEAAEAKDGISDDRTRRSGSGSILELLGSTITQKLSSFIGASSGHNAEPDHSYGPPVTSYDHKSFDIWTFKKAILGHLLQAVKAIKGGIIALGGQLIKVKGHVIATTGKIVSQKGEAISGFGRHIAQSALQPPATAPATAFATAHAAVDPIPSHVPDTGYPYPDSSYGPPSYNPSLSNSYSAPHAGYSKRGANQQQFGVPQELPHGVQAGLLVLKPVNVLDQTGSQYIDPRHKGFGAKDSYSSPSELIQHTAQARSYYVRY